MESRPAQQEERHGVENKPPPRKVPGVCSFRYGLAVLLHFINFGNSAQRVCLSLTMVAMVNRTDTSSVLNVSVGEKLDDIKNPVYNWSPDIQGIMLSSSLYGSLIFQIPVGYLSGRYPVKKLIGSALLLSSVFSLISPPAAELGPAVFIVCRAIQGIAQGTVTIAQHTTWVKWAPPLERGRLTSVSHSGILLGPFVVMLVSGFICDILGWPMVFYMLGAFGCVLSVLWFILFYDDPKDHPWISPSEKEYITSSLPQKVSSYRHLPIKAMLKSLPLWAIALVNFAVIWTNFLFTMYTPTYLNNVLHVNMRENGLLSGLPQLCAYICGILAGVMSDFFLCRNILSLITIRKLFTSVGLLLPVVFSMSLLVPGLDFPGTVILLVLVSASLSVSWVGGIINVLDIAPRYYGFLQGVITLIGLIGGMTSPTVAGQFLNQDPDFSWHKLFLLTAGIDVTCLLFYLVFAKAEIQDWAQEARCTQL